LCGDEEVDGSLNGRFFGCIPGEGEHVQHLACGEGVARHVQLLAPAVVYTRASSMSVCEYYWTVAKLAVAVDGGANVGDVFAP
jgi:hypothetical protein